MAALMRNELQTYMDVTPTSETPDYELVGEGFDELTESLNPEVKENARIHQKSKSKTITGYSPEYNFTAENDDTDPVVAFVANVGRARLIGDDAETTIVNVELFNETETAGAYVAYQQRIAVKVDQVNGGNGAEVMPMTGSFLYKGDAVKGTFVLETKVFTAEV